jgi:hypothetical protein
MKRVSYVLKQRLADIPNDNQYEHIKDNCSYYHRVWVINRGLLDSSIIYGDLFGFNTFIDEVR